MDPGGTRPNEQGPMNRIRFQFEKRALSQRPRRGCMCKQLLCLTVFIVFTRHNADSIDNE